MKKSFTLTLVLSFLFFSLQSQVYINEIVYDPVAPNSDGGSSAGEWVELYAATTTDISCFILTDGDWTVTIPNGTTITAGSYYTIGKASFANTPGVDGTTPIDLDLETCDCTNGISGMMELTNGGEFIGMYDPISTPPDFIDGLLYESPSAGNTPTGEVSIDATADPDSTGCAASVTIDLLGTAGGYTTVGSASGSTVGVARTTDGTGAWGYTTNSEASPKASNNPLPVELISFGGAANEEGVNLYWSTATELNNEYFEIQHSIDGDLFEVVGREKGAGTITSVQNYSFKHKNGAEGTHYYRLNQVDFDGKKEYSKIISVKVFGKNDFLIYPTFVKNSLTIENKVGFGKNAQYEVFDISGRKIQSGLLDEDATKFQINTAKWYRGHFVIQISKKGIRVTKRIVK